MTAICEPAPTHIHVSRPLHCAIVADNANTVLLLPAGLCGLDVPHQVSCGQLCRWADDTCKGAEGVYQRPPGQCLFIWMGVMFRNL